MSLEDKELMQFKVGKKEQYAARMAFFIPGFAISTWAPMIPMIKERLHIEADILGLLLLCIGISAFIVIPIGGLLGKKFGCKKVMVTKGSLCLVICYLFDFSRRYYGLYRSLYEYQCCCC